MKKDLYIFRHGETDYNLEHRWQGCGLDAVLNENGEEQARKLAEKVLSLGMTVLYCSPLVRAVQTANKNCLQKCDGASDYYSSGFARRRLRRS